MRIKYKRVLVIIFVALLSVIATPNKAKAGLQANKEGKSLTNTNVSAYFTGMRRMETQYGTLGKNAILNEKYLDTTNNGIDSHMILNTEWGAVAFLTDSTFGVGAEISTAKLSTSTGNTSGVYNFRDNYAEYTATICEGGSNAHNSKLASADTRYFNNYTKEKKLFNGDALDCRTWLNGSNGNAVGTSIPTYVRAYMGKMFGTTATTGEAVTSYGSRAVVVCGEGL